MLMTECGHENWSNTEETHIKEIASKLSSNNSLSDLKLKIIVKTVQKVVHYQ